jgi:phosphomevalonate kinase
MSQPVVVLFSGKRKSGKDFIVERIQERWLELNKEPVLSVTRLSEPLKGEFARMEGKVHISH